MILERGALLNNRYRIVEILGQGGMGSVYRAIDENLGVEVAVKDNLFTTDEYARQFRREAVILANLRHPNMPRVTDHFVIEGQGQYLVMDYIEGEDLRQRMDRAGLLNEEEAITIGAAICDVLTYLGSLTPPVVHRDIKPGNVKINPLGEIFLVDFGLAKMVQGSQATTTGARAMTPGYSPPEQYGTARTDQRSDIFSLGATLYAGLTGAIPEDALARAMGQTKLTPIRKHNPNVSRRLANIVEKSLEVRPEDRFQDTESFKRALLSARSNSRRRGAPEYAISPPPEVQDQPSVSNHLHQQVLEDSAPFPSQGSSAPIKVSTPIKLPRDVPAPGRSGLRGCWLVLLLFGLLMVGGGTAAYVYDPQLPTQAMSFFFPSAPTQAPTIVTREVQPTETWTPEPATTETEITSIVEPVEPSATPTEMIETTLTLTPSPEIEANTPTPSFTPFPTPLGGGGGEIAFASDRTGTNQIYIADVDGSDLRQLTDMPEGACQPDWSPDGERLVFISPCESNQMSYPQAGLFLINVDGSGLMPLPTSPGGDFDPAWSPDGSKIAFTTLRNSGRPRIYVYNLEDGSVSRISDEYSRDMQPAWSSDGKKIAFISTRQGPSHVWTMDADGGNQQLFSHSGNLINRYPTWSPDGQFILYTQLPKLEAFPKLVIAPVEEEGKQEYIINTGPVPMREARYSPDGLWLAMESWPDGRNHDIFIMTTNGAGRHQLTNEPSEEFDPVWRPAKAGQ